MENKLNIKEYLDKDEQKDLLRLLTAGSVDDGKSTLIGRLLFDSKKLYEDQLAALERDSKRVGNAGDHIDYALLCDGLKAEREYNPQIQISAESETKRSIFREKDKTKRSKKESAQHSKSRNKSFVMTSVSAL